MQLYKKPRKYAASVEEDENGVHISLVDGSTGRKIANLVSVFLDKTDEIIVTHHRINASDENKFEYAVSKTQTKEQNMNLFIGTKILKGRPMNRAEYCTYRGWELPTDENGEDAGMLVEYLDGGKANHPDHEGYISWSPIDVFNRAYRPVDGMTFGQAIEAMKVGRKVARAGWNGKGVFLFIAHDIEFVTNASLESVAKEPCDVLPAIVMYTATGEFCVGWIASQTDILSDDWSIVE